jgi:CheY-like chemotaxis protein
MTTPSHTGPTVLVIEDNATARKGLSAILLEAGYHVVALENGKQGLDYLRASHPDLIILDMLLPVLDGWKFLQEVQHWSKPPNVPIIVSTGTNISREWAESHGCAGFLHKPIDSAALLAEVQRCLRG